MTTNHHYIINSLNVNNSEKQGSKLSVKVHRLPITPSCPLTQFRGHVKEKNSSSGFDVSQLRQAI